MRVPFRESATVKLNGTGAGTAKVGPISARETWYPGVAAVSANANPTNESRCNISVGDVNTLRFVDGTVSGSSGDNTGKIASSVIRCGEFVWAVWSGGDANQMATLTVTGEKEV
jgi:hypothetical protein